MNNQDDKGDKKNDIKYLKEMEENLKLFEMKLKKLENNNHPEKVNEIVYTEQIIDNEYENRNIIHHYKNNKNISDLQDKFENDNTPHVRELERELNLRNIENKKLREENDNLKRVIESLKKANNELADELENKESENSLIMAKLNDKDKENTLLEKKVNTNDSLLKNIKFDYENLIKNFSHLKKQLETMTDKIEVLKADNYNLMQENQELTKKPTRPQTPLSVTSEIRIVKQPQIVPKKVSTANDQWEFPCEYKPESVKNEVSFIETRLSDLLKEKTDAENNLLKLPINPRTLNEINKKKAIEQNLKEIENNISEHRNRMRQLK
jgi:chromosome segregation ATPase